MSFPEDTPAGELVRIPLFPLNVVLFPGMPMPLHIFEERYKAMIGGCLERGEPFGIVLIKEGREVGDPAEPVRIGTTARIVQSETLEEGRLNIMTRGERRFEVVDVFQRVPHVAAEIRYMEEAAGDDLSSVIAEISPEYAEFLRMLTALSGGWTAQPDVPEEPVELSFSVASALVTSIPLPTDIKQQLLESSTAKERLERLVPLIKRGNEALREEVAKRNPFKGPRLN
jgi:Lon protease-like protein